MFNLEKDKGVFNSSLMEFYPGFRGGNGCVENLSSFKINASFYPESTEVYQDVEDLQFDIERHIRWDSRLRLKPFLYSTMINGYYPINRKMFPGERSYPTKEEFVGLAQKLKGFRVYSDKPSWFSNDQNSVIVNWILSEKPTLLRRGRVSVGVIQRDPISDLSVVTGEIVPYVVALFNHLSPKWKISDDVTKEAIEIATLKNEYIPRCRVKKNA
jgi:hypothetical protein